MNGEKSKCLKKIKVLPQSIQIDIPSAWHQPKSISSQITIFTDSTNNEKNKIISTNNHQQIKNKNAVAAAETKHFLEQYKQNDQQINRWWHKICFEICCCSTTSCKTICGQAKKIQQDYPATSLVPWVLVTNSLIQVIKNCFNVL